MYYNNQVQQTKDYSLFKSIKGNRDINRLHYNRLKKSIQNNYLFTIIIVNEKFEIIDGQHRFEAIKKLGLPLYYIVCTGYGVNEVQILNQNSKNWSIVDFMNGYCDKGIQDYILYRNFVNKYKFGHLETMAMLRGMISSGSGVGIDFKNGNFKTTHYEQACKLADLICSVKQYYKGYNRRFFIFALLKLFKNENFSFDEFIHKLQMQPYSLVDCVSVDQYIMLIEEIYNYKRRTKVSLRY